jgi:hypothetical protein
MTVVVMLCVLNPSAWAHTIQSVSHSPSGPTTSTAELGSSGLLLLTLDLGRSKKRSETSGGTVIVVEPIRDLRRFDVENVLEDVDRAGARKEGISWVRVASRRRSRRGVRIAEQDMLASRSIQRLPSLCVCARRSKYQLRRSVLPECRVGHVLTFSNESYLDLE